MIRVDHGFREDGTASNLLLPAQIAPSNATRGQRISGIGLCKLSAGFFSREFGRRQANPRPPSLKQHLHPHILKSIDSGGGWERRAAARRTLTKRIGVGAGTSAALHGVDYIEIRPASGASRFDYIEILPASGVPALGAGEFAAGRLIPRLRTQTNISRLSIARRRAAGRRHGFEYTEMRPASDVSGHALDIQPESNFRHFRKIDFSPSGEQRSRSCVNPGAPLVWVFKDPRDSNSKPKNSSFLRPLGADIIRGLVQPISLIQGLFEQRKPRANLSSQFKFD
ncbi:hypothetical protein R3P38DRAFT_3349963 [Favolaschia claudopus]|uniref:Ribosomal protein L2 n=1 Tax=Favolaschia claudopus TaxID=2862362 RepID=A0AAW0CNB2_9AGAR